MASPILAKQSGKSDKIELNNEMRKLFQVINSEKNKPEVDDSDIPKIKVSSLVSRLALIYEKARNAIEYEDEHLLRKSAIFRILKRQIVIEGVVRQAEHKEIATHLLTEIIRGGYLPNNKIPESKIDEVAFILEKFMTLKEALLVEIGKSFSFRVDLSETKDKIKEKNYLTNWIIVLAACEIEENLAPNSVKRVVVANMFNFLSKKIELPIELRDLEKDKEVQIYLSVARNYLKLDEDTLSFVLFKYYNSFWNNLSKDKALSPSDKEKINSIAKNFSLLKKQIEDDLKHPLKKELDKIAKTYSLYFNVLVEAIEKDPIALYADVQKGEKSYANSIKKVCNDKYEKAKKRLWRTSFRSIIYIFLTKSVFVLAIEVPAIKLFGEELNIISLLINIIFPAVLLFFIVLTTRKPGSDNTEKIIAGIKEISLVDEEKKKPLVLKKPHKRNAVTSFIFNTIYAASFSFSIYIIIKILSFINFTWVSIIIFLFFLAFVSFFSIVTTKGVKELLVVEKKESIVSLFLDLFYLPIVMAGRFLSSNMSKVNVIVFVFDFIIEAPFKIFVSVIEDWTKYVKEKRENMG